MPTILKFSRKSDAIYALFPGQKPEDVRWLYPLTIATLFINLLKAGAGAEAEEMCKGAPAELMRMQADRYCAYMLLNFEVQGFDTFRTIVRGEYAGSHLEDWEIREAFDIICRYARDPLAPLQFHFSTPEEQAKAEAAIAALQGVQVH